jgi:hypothetical protein
MRLLPAWLAGALIAAANPAAVTAQQPELLRLTQRVPASTLDSTLPAVPFERWLAELGGLTPKAIRWEVNDCGEGGDGLAAPTCVEAIFDLAPHTTAHASLIVAGIDGAREQPAIWMLSTTTGTSVANFRKLSDWVRYVRRHRR